MTPAASIDKPDLFERIAEALPVEQREEYWHEMSYLKHLHPEDELLRLTRATGYLTQISQSVPMLIAEERKRFETLLRESVAAIERTHQATQTYYRKLDERLAKMPAEIAKEIAPEAIAARISESLRQQFAETGLPETAQALTLAARQIKQAAGDFDRTAGQLTNSYGGAAENARRAIDQVRSSISTAANAATDATKRLSAEFSRDYKWSIFTLTGSALMLGLLLGFILHWWMNPQAEGEPQPSAPAGIQSIPQNQNPLPPMTKSPRKKPASGVGKTEQ